MNIYQGEQSNEMSSGVANASLRYYEEAFGIDAGKLAANDSREWEKVQAQYPPAFIMQIEELMCRARNSDQRYPS